MSTRAAAAEKIWSRINKMLSWVENEPLADVQQWCSEKMWDARDRREIEKHGAAYREDIPAELLELLQLKDDE